MRAARQRVACVVPLGDSDLRGPVTVPALSTAVHLERRSRMSPTCGVCGRPALKDRVDAGGDIGVVHHACFVEWDARQEALEQMLASSCGFLHQAEDATDSELDGIDPSLPCRARASTRFRAFKRTGSRIAACTSLKSANSLERTSI